VYKGRKKERKQEKISSKKNKKQYKAGATGIEVVYSFPVWRDPELFSFARSSLSPKKRKNMRSLIIRNQTIADNQRGNEELVTVAFLGIEIYRKQNFSSSIKPSALMTIRILGITVWAKKHECPRSRRRVMTYKLFGRLPIFQKNKNWEGSPS
jgi:hypothetical protein